MLLEQMLCFEEKTENTALVLLCVCGSRPDSGVLSVNVAKD